MLPMPGISNHICLPHPSTIVGSRSPALLPLGSYWAAGGIVRGLHRGEGSPLLPDMASKGLWSKPWVVSQNKIYPGQVGTELPSRR